MPPMVPRLPGLGITITVPKKPGTIQKATQYTKAFVCRVAVKIGRKNVQTFFLPV
jgi:hypothetical protein